MPFCNTSMGGFGFRVFFGLGFYCRTHCWALTTCCKIVDPMSNCFSSFFPHQIIWGCKHQSKLAQNGSSKASENGEEIINPKP
jgi:hypothetical protein